MIKKSEQEKSEESDVIIKDPVIDAVCNVSSDLISANVFITLYFLHVCYMTL